MTPHVVGRAQAWASGRGPRRAANVLAVLLLVALVAPFVAFAFPQAVGADASYVVLSGSMEPAISPGDVVFVAAARPEAVAVGDVITFERGAGVPPTTHRVVAITEVDGARSFVTKGDSNEDPDAVPVPASALVGRVTVVVPLAGYVVLFADTQYGWLVLVGVPLCLLVLNETWQLIASRRVRSAPALPAGPTAEASADAADAPTDEAETGDAAGDAADGATADSPAGTGRPSYQVSVVDLSLTALSLGVLAAYSGWSLARELGAGSVRVETTMVFAGAAVALLLVAGGRLSAALAARRARRERADGDAVAADGGRYGGDN